MSLKEAAIVLAVSALVLTAVLKVVANIRQNATSITLLKQINMTAQGFRDLYLSRPLPSSASFTDAQLISAGIYPEDVCDSACRRTATTTLKRNVYGGSLVAGYVTSPSVQPNQFTITLSTVPAYACTFVGTQLSTNVAATGLSKIVVGSTTITTFPVVPTTMISACSSATANSMVLTFLNKL